MGPRKLLISKSTNKRERISERPSSSLPHPSPSFILAMSSSDLKSSFPTSHDTSGYVGFANLPNQVHRKSVRKGFQFTVMVVGESGLGKSTLVNTLFNTALSPPKVVPDPSHERPKTVNIETISADIEESGV